MGLFNFGTETASATQKFSYMITITIQEGFRESKICSGLEQIIRQKKNMHAVDIAKFILKHYKRNFNFDAFLSRGYYKIKFTNDGSGYDFVKVKRKLDSYDKHGDQNVTIIDGSLLTPRLLARKLEIAFYDAGVIARVDVDEFWAESEKVVLNKCKKQLGIWAD